MLNETKIKIKMNKITEFFDGMRLYNRMCLYDSMQKQ
jgi:hypothetical protein